MKLSEMQRKDIVHLKTGRKIGKIIDAEVEITNGKIVNLMIERKNIKNIFISENDVIIKFEEIKKIGEDVILVDSLE